MNERKIIKKRSNKFIKIINVLVVIAFVVVVTFMSRIAIFQTIGSTNLQDFQKTRMLEEDILYAERGSIYDVNGTSIAQTVPTYNMYAILDESYSKDQRADEKKLHVVDPERIAREVSAIIGMDQNRMYELLTSDGFQVEFAPHGNGLTQRQKDAIDALELEGIYFNEHDSRAYPQGVFASHVVGYASYDQETKELEGAMGLEATLNDKWLKGINGIHKFQTNVHGQKIKDAPEEYIPAQNGSNVYLTLDSYIQRRVDETLQRVQAEHQPAWAVIAIADPKTGEILGLGQTPTFDPNTKEISNYTNYFTEAEYEVGSIMKTITYASAVDTGKYDPNRSVQTGSLHVDDWTISDWNNYGWGTIRSDQGLFYSSNTAIASLVDNVLTADEQREYLRRFGFGKPTNVEMPSEASGTFVLNNRIERITTGYGQGTTATVAQMLQAYSAIANHGQMMELHVVDRIEDSTGKLKYQHENRVVGEPISQQSADYVMGLLVDSVNSDGAYSARFRMNTGTMAGKTGTANVASPTGGYLPSYDTNYTYSFAGVAITNEPQFVIIASVSLPQVNPNGATSTAINGLSDDINTYLSIKKGNPAGNIQTDNTTNVTTIESFPSFINRRRDDVVNYMGTFAHADIIFIGDGDRVIDQSVEPYTRYLSTEKLLVRTNGATVTLPNFTGWSRKDIEIYAAYAGIVIQFQGDGYAVEQSQPEGTVITEENRNFAVRLE